MPSKSHWWVLLLYSFLILTGLSVCKNKQSVPASPNHRVDNSEDRKRAELQYRLIQTELLLAKTSQPYLVIDLDKNRLELKLKGAVVWNQPIQLLETDSQEVRDFAQRFEGENKELVRPLSDKFLFTAKNKTPDSVLTIISDAVKAKPELMQRDVPERFQLFWDSNLILEVRTEISGKPKEKLKGTIVKLRHTIERPFGESHITIKMSPEAALTLYRAAHPGLPTFIYSSF
jgi:type II secretory pathway component PulC